MFENKATNQPHKLDIYVSVIDPRVPCDVHILYNERNLENN
jgi:hypothetical protein